jgi:hypothetical protein
MKYVLILTLVFAVSAFALDYNEEPDKDTWTWPGYGPYGGSSELRTNRVDIYDQEILASWDLTSIPVGSTINSAEANFYRYDGWSGTLDCDLFRCTEDWPETVTGNVDHDSTSRGDIAINGSGWYTFDIMDLVQEWIDETYDNYGVVWYGTGTGSYFQRIYSREAGSNNPYLEIDYDLPVGVESASVGEIKAAFK